jgi:acyl-CoA synthetase (AMP-forming)/AMP-acid ligase II
MPEKTREEFTADGFFITGDMGSWDADFYITISGRSKDLVITGGLNVYPKEIEELIDALPGVAESAVIGLPHADFGEAVTAVVVRQKNAAGKALTRSRHHRRGQGQPGEFQGAEVGVPGRRAAAQRHGQGAEKPAAPGIFANAEALRPAC